MLLLIDQPLKLGEVELVLTVGPVHWMSYSCFELGDSTVCVRVNASDFYRPSDYLPTRYQTIYDYLKHVASRSSPFRGVLVIRCYDCCSSGSRLCLVCAHLLCQALVGS